MGNKKNPYQLWHNQLAKLRILGKTSSINVRKVLWTCAEIDIDYVQEEWGNGFKDTNSKEFLDLNPNGLVPVMIHGDFVLWESNTICRYLAALYDRFDLLPQMPQTYYHVQQWMDWQATTLNSSWRYAFMGLVRHHPLYQDEALVKSSESEWNKTMGILEAQLNSTQAYVCGNCLTLADIVIGLSVHRWLSSPIDHAMLPGVKLYYQRLHDHTKFSAFAQTGIA